MNTYPDPQPCSDKSTANATGGEGMVLILDGNSEKGAQVWSKP